MTVFSSIITFSKSVLGSSNIVSIRMSSIIDLKPLAPVFLLIACLAISISASSLKVKSTLSISNKCLYWLTKAFFGSLRILTKACSSSSCRFEITGSLPTNSGIKPYFTRSSGSRLSTEDDIDWTFDVLLTSAAKPIPILLFRWSITLSRPEKAPPQINNMFDVSIWINSCWGCFLPPWGGIDATVPSISFRSACCTPSPDTSLVIEGLADFLAIISISSIYTIPSWALSGS